MLPKIVHFIWLCLHNSVLVKEVLTSRGINCEGRCSLCKDHNETISHLLKECTYVQEFWHKLHVPPALIGSFNCNLHDWLRVNCQSKESHPSTIPWKFLFPFAVWNLWKHRNRVIFENTTLQPNLHRQWVSQALEYFFYVGKIKMQQSKVAIPVKWNKPPPGWYKLSTDGHL